MDQKNLTLTPEQFALFQQLLEKQKADEAKKRSKIRASYGASGAISLYGINQRPVTLYAEQWDVIFTPEIQAKIAETKALPEHVKAQQIAEGKVRAEAYKARKGANAE